MQLLDNYNDTLQELYDYFDYEESAVIPTIDDNRGVPWIVNKEGTKVNYYQDGEMYEMSLIVIDKKDKEKSVYEGKDYTMITVVSDNFNRFLAIFENSKRIIS